MKINFNMNIAKTLTGLGMMALGGVMATIPLVQAASPLVIKTGAGIAMLGAADKVRKVATTKGSIRTRLKASVKTETEAIRKMRGKGGQK